MSQEKISEKVYYEDSNVKVTNARLTCNHMTAPIEKIDSVYINFQTVKFSASIIFLVLSASILLFCTVLPETLLIPIAILSLILMAASAVFVYTTYVNYVELMVLVTGRKVSLLSSGMLNKAYMENLCDKISDAIFDEKKYRDLKSSGELESALKLNPSETLRLKMVLEDYEELKKLKEQFYDKNGSKKQD